MLFNSLEFAFFLPVVLAVIFLLRGQKLYKKLFLIAASLFFYASWNYVYLWVLIGSILFNYFCSRALSASEASGKKLILIFAVSGNIFLLCVYKYSDFIIDNFNFTLSRMKIHTLPPLGILLPIGISFFTFQSISYIIDVYKKRIPPAGLVNLSLYISFFPHLIAGPIIRPAQILPQMENANTLQKENLAAGFHRIFWGLIKKMVIADNLAIFVNHVFSRQQDCGWLTLVTAVYAFAFQIYCDFSGYSDIAIGCFKILGYDIAENFNLPYAAGDFSDFWRRWHISLSGWLRDYLYIPLGGNRWGIKRTYFNLIVTMLLGGLWHGAKWTFVIWGMMHGLYLAAQKAIEKHIVLPKSPLFSFLKVFVTFQLVCLAWVFFRAESLLSAAGILSGIVTLRPGANFITGNITLLLFTCIILHFLKYRFPVYKMFISLPYYVRYFAYSIGVFLLFFNKAGTSSQFIYFQF